MSSKPPKRPRNYPTGIEYEPQLGAPMYGLAYSSTDVNTAIENRLNELFSALSSLRFPRDESQIISILGSIHSASTNAVSSALLSIGPSSGHGELSYMGRNNYTEVQNCVKTGLQNPIKGEGNNKYNFFQVLALKNPWLAFSLLSKVDEGSQSNLLQSLSDLSPNYQKNILKNPDFWLNLYSYQKPFIRQIAIRMFVNLFATEDPQKIFEVNIMNNHKITKDSYNKTGLESLLKDIKKAKGSVVSVNPATTPALTPKSQSSSTDSINTNRTVPVTPPSRAPSAAVRTTTQPSIVAATPVTPSSSASTATSASQTPTAASINANDTASITPPSRTPSAAVQTTTSQHQNTLAVPVEPRKPIMRKQVQAPIEDQCKQGLRAVLDKLIEHQYELHGGSNKLDKNTKKQLAGLGINPHSDKKFARGARKAIADITECLVNKPDPNNSSPNECKQWCESAIDILRTVGKNLTARTEASSGFFGRGARSQSTIKLYLDIIKMTRETSTRLDDQPDNTRPIM